VHYYYSMYAHVNKWIKKTRALVVKKCDPTILLMMVVEARVGFLWQSFKSGQAELRPCGKPCQDKMREQRGSHCLIGQNSDWNWHSQLVIQGQMVKKKKDLWRRNINSEIV
jgi:hypothetical protein